MTDSVQAVLLDKHNIGVAVDLGSTTIAVSCIELESGKELTAFTFPNPQYVYGADVITRIRHCMESEEILQKAGNLVKDHLLEALKEHLGSACERICQIVYSGNTIMFHLLRGLPVDGLACAPFTPVTTEYAEETIHLFSKDTACMDDKNRYTKTQIIYLPGFSAYVGADILAGAQYLQMGKEESYDLLVDLGTNGELLLLNHTHGYASSTACGPVFDSAITGAAYGSECIKAIANCIKRQLIGTDGVIAAPFFDRGIEIDRGFKIRQEHVRNFQLAKSAIYSGIQCLMKQAGINASQIRKVYISGGLGFYMNIRDAFTVGMLPKEFNGKITVSGNSSLDGAKELLISNPEQKKLILAEYEAIRERTMSFELADLEHFKEWYIQSLNF